MKSVSILFFGSTTDSVIVLDKLASFSHPLFQITIEAVVTQPPRPVGRLQVLTKTPVEVWAEAHKVAVLSFPSNPEKPWLYTDEQTVIDTLESCKADLLISASYGQKIPSKTLADAAFGGLNIHPSILPRWRGGDPVPWAIMTGDHQIGVTVVSLADKFDEGLIYAQEKIPIHPKDTSDPLRTKLFGIGAELLVSLLPQYLEGKAKGIAQHGTDDPRAKRLNRDLGFEPWDAITKALTDPEEAQRIDRKFRALTPWPGLWTTFQEKRLKILEASLRDTGLELITVQREGKNPVSWQQFSRAYLKK